MNGHGKVVLPALTPHIMANNVLEHGRNLQEADYVRKGQLFVIQLRRNQVIGMYQPALDIYDECNNKDFMFLKPRGSFCNAIFLQKFYQITLTISLIVIKEEILSSHNG